jgi:hypothetical protein
MRGRRGAESWLVPIAVVNAWICIDGAGRADGAADAYC